MRVEPDADRTSRPATLARLGSRAARLVSQAEEYIDERHRHRYEVNPDMVEELEAAGLRFVGRDETGTRMEIVELAPELDHPFFIGSQFHPEVGPPCSWDFVASLSAALGLMPGPAQSSYMVRDIGSFMKTWFEPCAGQRLHPALNCRAHVKACSTVSWHWTRARTRQPIWPPRWTMSFAGAGIA